ncbi:MAG: Sulfurtransferase [Clostridiales bacterium 38_11]|nr:MAG: Sulfurtransferase [Clostridiales bacterium 38_11]HBH12310.1 rhodanese-like domain-containing protein [Clostridiales bacterium]
MMKRILIILLIAFMLITGCTTQTQETTLQSTSAESVENAAYIKITAQEAKEIIDTKENVIVVDVRTAEEYAEGHIPNSMLIPGTQIGDLAPDMLPDLDQTILVYCRSGNRSAAAAKVLIEMGYTNIMDFGGIKDWPYEIVK